MYQPHIMVVDDDKRLRELLRKYLSDNGYLVTTAQDSADARAQLAGLAVDLLVLDVMMPGETGFELTKSLRQEGNVTPVLLLTAMGEVDDRITGLEAGADDYLSKPFEPRELLLRIGSILRRVPKTEVDGTILRFGDFGWDQTREELSFGDDAVHLTTAERELMIILSNRAGETVSRDELAELTGNEANPRAVDVQVTRLRKKLEDDSRMPRYLQTVRGMGYVLKPD